MGRKKKLRNIKPWDLITGYLVDILDGFKLKRSGRDYFNVYYAGTTKELRKACIRILNVLDSMERIENMGGDPDGSYAEIGREKISYNADSDSYRNLD